MRLHTHNIYLPFWLSLSSRLLHTPTFEQLLATRGYSSNLDHALDELTLKLFRLQHLPSMRSNETICVNRFTNHLASPLAMFIALGLLHTFIGDQTTVSRNMQRNMLNSFGLNSVRVYLKSLLKDSLNKLENSKQLLLLTVITFNEHLSVNQTLLRQLNQTNRVLFQQCSLQQPKNVRKQINAHVAKASAGELPHFLPPDSLFAGGEFLMHQFIGISARWAKPFQALRSHERTFHNADGSQVRTLFLEMRSLVQLIFYEGLHVLRLPYEFHDFALYIFGGMEDSLSTFSDLNSTQLRLLLNRSANCFPVYAQIRLPRFRLDSMLTNMRPLVERAGITYPFNCAYANFPALLKSHLSHPLCIFDWNVRIKIAINELGSGVQALDGEGFFGNASQNNDELFQVTFDQPFVLILRHEKLRMNVITASVNKL